MTENANDSVDRISQVNPMIVGDVPDGETEPKPLVKPYTIPKKDQRKYVTDHNVETEPGQTATLDQLHPGEEVI